MVEFGTFSAFRGWVRVRVLGYGFGERGRKVKSRDCALASDLVRAIEHSIAMLCHFALSYCGGLIDLDFTVAGLIMIRAN